MVPKTKQALPACGYLVAGLQLDPGILKNLQDEAASRTYVPVIKEVGGRDDDPLREQSRVKKTSAAIGELKKALRRVIACLDDAWNPTTSRPCVRSLSEVIKNLIKTTLVASSLQRKRRMPTACHPAWFSLWRKVHVCVFLMAASTSATMLHFGSWRFPWASASFPVAIWCTVALNSTVKTIGFTAICRTEA
jgi:hypothetical protein